MLPREIFKILHAVMIILVFFLTFFRQTLFQFFDPNSEYFTKYGAFCSHIFNCACLRRKDCCYRRGSKL